MPGIHYDACVYATDLIVVDDGAAFAAAAAAIEIEMDSLSWKCVLCL